MALLLGRSLFSGVGAVGLERGAVMALALVELRVSAYPLISGFSAGVACRSDLCVRLI